MYLFKSPKGGLTVQALTPLAGTVMPTTQKMRSLFKALEGQENPYSMRGLLLTLVGVCTEPTGCCRAGCATQARRAEKTAG